MKPDWARWSKGSGFDVEPPIIRVAFAEGRSHRVEVLDEGDAFLIRGVGVDAPMAEAQEDLALRAWLLNRKTSLVGFRIDDRGRLVAEARAPKAGLSAPEFQLYVHAVAAESDRLEYTLSGEDVG